MLALFSVPMNRKTHVVSFPCHERERERREGRRVETAGVSWGRLFAVASRCWGPRTPRTEPANALHTGGFSASASARNDAQARTCAERAVLSNGGRPGFVSTWSAAIRWYRTAPRRRGVHLSGFDKKAANLVNEGHKKGAVKQLPDTNSAILRHRNATRDQGTKEEQNEKRDLLSRFVLNFFSPFKKNAKKQKRAADSNRQPRSFQDEFQFPSTWRSHTDLTHQLLPLSQLSRSRSCFGFSRLVSAKGRQF
jgi:hypothetical protein